MYGYTFAQANIPTLKSTAMGKPAVSAKLLDTYSGAAAAYSLRKLRTAYTGYAICVRRSSDNTSQDIGFDGNGNLDTTSMLSFVGAGNGFVSIWYDQSSTYDALQTTLTNQPIIVSNGMLITQNNKITVKFDGVNNFLLTNTYSFTSTDKLYGVHVSTIETSNVNSMVVGQFKQFNPSVYFLGYISSGKSMVSIRNSTNTTSNNYLFGSYVINNQYLFETQLDLLNTQSVLKVKNWRNNQSEVMTSNGFATTSLPSFSMPISIGADSLGTNFKFKGNIQEIVLYYNSDKTNERPSIANNINSYYSIY